MTGAGTPTEGVGDGFTRTADAYDEVVRHNMAGAARLVAAIPDGTYRDVLDVGCGTGFAALAMADRFGPLDITGVDASEGMLERFREKVGGRPGIGVTAHRADVHAMPVPSAAFDAVICSMAFHWFPRKAEAMAAMARPLRPGGILALLCPGAGGEEEFRRVLARIDPPVPAWVGTFEVVQRDIPDMEDHLRHAGLEALDIWMERRIRRTDPDAYLERMRVVAGHIAPGAADADREELDRRVREALHAASGPDGFAYTFTKLFVIARRPA